MWRDVVMAKNVVENNGLLLFILADTIEECSLVQTEVGDAACPVNQVNS